MAVRFRLRHAVPVPDCYARNDRVSAYRIQSDRGDCPSGRPISQTSRIIWASGDFISWAPLGRWPTHTRLRGGDAERLLSVTVISSLSPFDVPNATEGLDPLLARLWRSSPRVQRFLATLVALGSRFAPEAALIPTRDAHASKFFEDPEIRSYFLRDMRESLADGGRAFADKLRMFSQPLDFDLGSIRIPVRLWQGETDANCPLAMGKYLASKIPNCDAHFFPNERHMCAFERLDEFFAPIIRESSCEVVE